MSQTCFLGCSSRWWLRSQKRRSLYAPCKFYQRLWIVQAEKKGMNAHSMDHSSQLKHFHVMAYHEMRQTRRSQVQFRLPRLGYRGRC